MDCLGVLWLLGFSYNFTDISMYYNALFAGRDQRACYRRRGTTFVELLVAGSMLVVVVSLIGRSTVAAGKLWMLSRQQVMAADEVANTLERLTALPDDELEAALLALEPSAGVQESLRGPKLTAAIAENSTGQRTLTVALDWNRAGDPQPVQLTAWLPAIASTTGLDDAAAGDAAGQQPASEEDAASSSDLGGQQ